MALDIIGYLNTALRKSIMKCCRIIYNVVVLSVNLRQTYQIWRIQWRSMLRIAKSAITNKRGFTAVMQNGQNSQRRPIDCHSELVIKNRS